MVLECDIGSLKKHASTYIFAILKKVHNTVLLLLCDLQTNTLIPAHTYGFSGVLNLVAHLVQHCTCKVLLSGTSPLKHES